MKVKSLLTMKSKDLKLIALEIIENHIFKKVHESKKPVDNDITKPYTDSLGDNLKSHIEKVHESKKPVDNEMKII